MPDNKDWMKNPKLASVDKDKLELLSALASQGQGKSQNELLPFLMSAASQGKEQGLNFSSQEISAIIEVLKMGKSRQEAARLDRIVSLMKIMK